MEDQLKQLQAQVQQLQTDFGAKAKELDEANKKLSDASQYIEDSSILVSAIMKDPVLQTQVKAAITGQPVAPQTPPATPSANQEPDKSKWKFDPETGKPLQAAPTPQKDERVDSLDGKTRMDIINAVESKFKYSGLKAEEKTALRKSVGAWLKSYGMEVPNIPVDELEEKLSDAYMHVGIEQAKEKSIDVGPVIDSYFTDPGKLPGMGSGNPDTSPTTLTPTHKKWADKLNVPEDKVSAGLKELTETGVITYKPKDKQPVTPPAPSGTPTPPPASN